MKNVSFLSKSGNFFIWKDVEKLLDYKKIYSIFNICTTKQHFLLFHYREEYLHVKIRRAFVLDDAVVKNPTILDQALVIVPINLKGEEIYCLHSRMCLIKDMRVAM